MIRGVPTELSKLLLLMWCCCAVPFIVSGDNSADSRDATITGLMRGDRDGDSSADDELLRVLPFPLIVVV